MSTNWKGIFNTNLNDKSLITYAQQRIFNASKISGIPVEPDLTLSDGGILSYDSSQGKITSSPVPTFSNTMIMRPESAVLLDTSAWVKVRNFIYDGTDNITKPTEIHISVEGSSAETFRARLFDLTNLNVVATSADISANEKAIISMGTLDNIPSGRSEFELQLQRDSTTLSVFVDSMSKI